MVILSETVHDFLTEQKWSFFFGGYETFKSTGTCYYLYVAYRILLILLFVFLLAMALAGAVLAFGDVVASVQCFHTSLIVVTCLGSVATRLSSHFPTLRRTMEMLRAGVFLYEEAVLEAEHERIKMECVEEIRSSTELFSKFMILAASSNIIFLPLVNFIIIQEDTSDRLINPYLPSLPVYMPFDTRSYPGYSAACVLYGIFMFALVSLLICIDTIYVSCTVQLRAQFLILNSSLRNIERRAYSRFVAKTKRTLKGEEMKEMYGNWLFLDSMYACLKSNLKHHHNILELKRTCQDYLGQIFFLLVTLSSSLCAFHLLLIMESRGIFMTANFVATLLCELYFAVHMCWYGEQVIATSSEVYYSAYSTPWYKCDRRFKTIISMMISNLRRPARIKTIVFDAVASLESFGKIMTTMYQIMSVMRNA